MKRKMGVRLRFVCFGKYLYMGGLDKCLNVLCDARVIFYIRLAVTHLRENMCIYMIFRVFPDKPKIPNIFA